MIFISSFIIIQIFFVVLIRSEFQNKILETYIDKASFFLPLSLISTLGFLGLISSYCYYLDIPTSKHINIVYLLAFFSIPFIWKKRKLLKINFIQNDHTKIEKLFLFMIFYMTFLHLHRAFAPWSDGDEIVTYGYNTKLIANGFTFSDKIVNGYPIFAESLFSYFYLVSNSTLLPKIIKVLGLLSLGQLIFFLVHHFTKSRKYGYIGTLLLLITPELSYLGTSLKTDNLLMLFEGTSLLCLMFLFYEKNKFEILFLTKSSIIITIFAVISFSIRFSGINCLLFISILLLIVLSKRDPRHLIVYMVITAIISSIFLIGFWINIYLYKNPFYPLGGFWTDFFTNSLYSEDFHIEKLKLIYNINFYNSFVEYFYVPLYISFGFGTTLFDWFTFIIHPLHKGVSIGWANPIIFLMFPITFLTIENKKLSFMTFSYLILYTVWFSSIQFTRIFLATTVLAILLYITAINYNYNNKIFNSIKKLALVYLLSIITIFPVYHTIYTFKRMPNKFFAGFSENSKYDSNLRYTKYLSKNIYNHSNDFFPFSINQIREIDDILEKKIKPIILTSIIGNPHIFFKYGLFTNNPESNYDCLLSNINFKNKLNNKFRELLYFRKFGLWCK